MKLKRFIPAWNFQVSCTAPITTSEQAIVPPTTRRRHLHDSMASNDASVQKKPPCTCPQHRQWLPGHQTVLN
jgi:hypothetical protein